MCAFISAVSETSYSKYYRMILRKSGNSSVSVFTFQSGKTYCVCTWNDSAIIADQQFICIFEHNVGHYNVYVFLNRTSSLHYSSVLQILQGMVQ